MEQLTHSFQLSDFDQVKDRAAITIAETGQLLGIGRSAAYEAARKGEIPSRRIGRRIIVPVPALLAWLDTAAA